MFVENNFLPVLRSSPSNHRKKIIEKNMLSMTKRKNVMAKWRTGFNTNILASLTIQGSVSQT